MRTSSDAAPYHQIMRHGSAEAQKFQREFLRRKNKVEEEKQQMRSYLESETAAEMEKVQQAVEELYRKEASLRESKQMQTREASVRKAQYALEDLVFELKSVARDARREIDEMTCSPQRKQKLWDEVTAGIESVVYSSDERAALGRLREQLEGTFGSLSSNRAPRAYPGKERLVEM